LLRVAASSSSFSKGLFIDSMTGRQVPLICSGHSRPVPDLAYSPITEDGCFLVSACLDGKPMLRNGETGDWIGTFTGHKGAVWSARINSSATMVSTGSADYTAKVWDAISGVELRTFTHSRIVKATDFSKDSQLLATAGQDKLVQVWNLEHGTNLATLSGHTQPIKSVLWLSDNTLLSGAADESIRLWDIRTKAQVKSCAAKSAVASMELSRDGKTLTTAAGKEVTFWDAETLVPHKVYTLSIELNSATLNPQGNKFVAGGSDFYVHLYDYATGEELDVHKGHHGPVHSVRFSPDGETYASGSEDGTIRLWQTVPKVYGLWQTSGSSQQQQQPQEKEKQQQNQSNGSSQQPIATSPMKGRT